MSQNFDAQVLQLLGQALEQPAAARAVWLATRPAPAAVRARVRELLEAEGSLERFLDRPAIEGAHLHAAPAFAAGQRLGPWRLLRELGGGGMGVVWLAERADDAYEQQVAIKFMRLPPLAGTRERADFRARFDNERRLLARIEHPNVARILDGGSTEEGLPYLVMEYVDGVPLNTWADRQHLDLGARVALFRKVCAGVQAAHRHLIIHRDLKPGNILVGADGEPRLLDFGIARAADSDSGAADPTVIGAMTPAYASPEQVRHEPLTTASDVYSLGVVLYELLCARRPYALEGLSPAQSERVISHTDPPTLRRAITTGNLPAAERKARLAGLGGDLERILAKALHKDPLRRYDSARAFDEDLARFLQHRPVLAHPDSTRYRFTRFLRRHPAGSLGAAAAVLLILAALGFALFQEAEAKRAAADTEQINAFLLEVINTPDRSGGTEITLAEALDDAASDIDGYFGARADLTVDIRIALGQSLFARNQLDSSERQLERARADAERLFGADDAHSLRAMTTLAYLRQTQNRLGDAEALYREVIDRMERSGQASGSPYYSALNASATLYWLQEDYARARSYLERALEVLEASGGSDDRRAFMLSNLARVTLELGDLESADQLYARAQPILERLYPNGGPTLANLLDGRANLAWKQGRRSRALELQTQATAMVRRSFKGDHPRVLLSMTNLADTQRELGQLDAAAATAQAAVDMAARLYVLEPAEYQVDALTMLSKIRLAQKRAADALALYARARDLYARLHEPPESTRRELDRLREALCLRPDARPADPCPSSG